jgi:hypothetical protein
MGDNLSFGLTSLARDALGIDDVIDEESGLYGAGRLTGTGVGLAFGGAHLGRNALYQMGARGGLRLGLRRLVYDGRTWGSVRSTWSNAAGGLRVNGQSLHHLFIPQRWGGVNAGFNYIPLSAGFNSWMNGSTALRLGTEWGLRGVVVGIYGSVWPY